MVTALIKEACFGHVECVDRLLQVGADVNKQNEDG